MIVVLKYKYLVFINFLMFSTAFSFIRKGSTSILRRSRASPHSCRKGMDVQMSSSSEPEPLINKQRKSVYAFDFDGVICDSEGETCLSAFKAIQAYWPEVVHQVPAEMAAGPKKIGTRTLKWPDSVDAAEPVALTECPDWLKVKMRALRPVVETGYENMLLERLCIEEEIMSIRTRDTTKSRPLTVAEIIANWDDLKANLMRRYDARVEELIEVFGTTRDSWIASDFEGWLGANSFYPVLDAVNNCTCDKYIITTKDKRFAYKLLENAGCPFEEDKIYGLGSGPKADTLAMLLDKYNSDAPDGEKTVIHFVEDKVETLEKICKDPRLDEVRLYFANWGYSTPSQKQIAKANPRVTCINAIEFMELTSAAYYTV